MCPKAPALFELHTAPAWRLLRFDGNLFAQCASHVSLCSEEIRLKFNRRLFGEHFKTRAGKVGRWLARSWNTILSPTFTVSTSGFGGFTRCSGGAFSYDPTALWPIFTPSCRSASTGRTSISIAFVSVRRIRRATAWWTRLPRCTENHSRRPALSHQRTLLV
jgi:hypothetical protein